MALATWWRGDPLPALEPLAGFGAALSDDAQLLATLAQIDVCEAQRRRDGGHRPFVAYLEDAAVAYGWVAMEGASIGELGLSFVLPAGDRYLWDFATLPAWRGRGIYPRLLQAILAHERNGAERFWIIYAPENGTSGAGIQKAGFRFVGELSFHGRGGAGLKAFDSGARAHVGAALLGVPLLEQHEERADEFLPLAPCWCCVIDARAKGLAPAAVSCWPGSADGGAIAPTCTCGAAPVQGSFAECG